MNWLTKAAQSEPALNYKVNIQLILGTSDGAEAEVAESLAIQALRGSAVDPHVIEIKTWLSLK